LRGARYFALAAATTLWLDTLCAATLSVQPGQSLADALRRAVDGDVIEIHAGAHHGQVGLITQKRLTIRGVGGRPVLFADGASVEGKAILVQRDGDVVIDNIEFRGARVPDGNGAGIRFERGRLLVQNCAFFDNQNGILTANFGDAELTVRDSQFGQAPAGQHLPHLLYVGRIARFTLSGSHFSGGDNGHLVKSRAALNHVAYNRLVDGAGKAAYELEFPNGGLAYVVGNVMGQSANTSNPAVLSFGAEGPRADAREHGLFVAHNTFINDGLRPAWFVRVHADKLGAPVVRVMQNNLFVGLGISDVQWADVGQGNHLLARWALQDADAGFYGLTNNSVLRGRAVAPATVGGETLAPQAQFSAPAGTRTLDKSRALSPGALQD
jgi:hypothetical protein